MQKKKKRYYSTTKRYAAWKHPHLFFRGILAIGRLVFPKHKTCWQEEPPPGEAAIYCANHAGAYGPVVMVTNFPRPFRPWVIDQVCFMKTFPAFSRMDFWHPKNPFSKGMFWVLSYLLAPLAKVIFCGVEAIPAHFNDNAHVTIQKSVQTLAEGKNVVIFPENRTPYSEYNEDFSSGFVYVARRYYRKTGQCLRFYPVFACRFNHTIQVGKPTVFRPEADFAEERERIKNYLRDEMTRLGRAQGGPAEYDVADKPVL